MARSPPNLVSNETDLETGNEGGFSLLEVLVAMALIALAVSTVMVNVRGMIGRSETKAFRESVVLMVRDARYAAITYNQNVKLAEHAITFFEGLDANMKTAPILLESDVVVQKSGLCTAGDIVAEQGDRRLAYKVQAFGCQLSLVAVP